ncbi:MAG: polysaccharide biosynthesis/export family protein [Actinomycetota bacterium]
MRSMHVLSVLAALAVTACGGVGVAPLQPEELPRLEAAGNFPHGQYRLEPGDMIDIRFTFHPEMSQQELVRPDGKVTAKLVGEVAVAGMTTTELEELLRQRKSDRLREPAVEVKILEFSAKSVYVTGEVLKPGMIPYQKGLTPLQAVVAAGGFRDTALTGNVILIRAAAEADRFVSRTLDLQEVVTSGGEEPLALAPHDVLYVPRTRIAEADIWVDQHVTRLFPFIRGTNASFPLGF